MALNKWAGCGTNTFTRDVMIWDINNPRWIHAYTTGVQVYWHCILAMNGREDMKKVVKELADKFEITDEGDIDEYVGLKVEKQRDGSIKMSQPLLIRHILDMLGLNKRTKGKSTPAIESKILH